MLLRAPEKGAARCCEEDFWFLDLSKYVQRVVKGDSSDSVVTAASNVKMQKIWDAGTLFLAPIYANRHAGKKMLDVPIVSKNVIRFKSNQEPYWDDDSHC